LTSLWLFFFSTPVTPAPEPPDTGDDGDKFTDADFPPNANSIGAIDGFPPEQAKWVRAPDLTPGEDHLFFNIEPNDISQGYLGDCWLLACLSCAAEFPGLVESLFMNKTIAEDGKYSLKLHDGQKWQQVIIDDYIPTIQGKPAFSKPHDNELWVLLIEKACAKFCQSYKAMEGGMFGCGFMMFTGCTEQYFFSNMEGMSHPWQKIKQTYAPVTNAGNATDSQQAGEVDSEQFFQYLKTGDAQNYMMGAGTFKDAPSSGEQGFSGGEDIGASGIVKGHAYSLLQVREEKADGQTMRMIQCRNPWGNNVEWKGAFSDGSPEWDDHPELRDLLGVDFKDDGLFWMTWEDFVAAMSFVCVGPHPVKTPKRNLLKQRDIPTCPANNNSYSRADPTANGRVRINHGPCQACVGADCVVM